MSSSEDLSHGANGTHNDIKEEEHHRESDGSSSKADQESPKVEGRRLWPSMIAHYATYQAAAASKDEIPQRHEDMARSRESLEPVLGSISIRSLEASSEQVKKKGSSRRHLHCCTCSRSPRPHLHCCKDQACNKDEVILVFPKDDTQTGRA